MKNSTDIISKFLSGNASAEETAMIMAWRKENASNERAFLEAEKTWNVSAMLHEEFKPDTQKGWEKLQGKIKQPEKVYTFNPNWMAIAAAVIILLVAGFMLNNIVFNQPSEKNSAQTLAKVEQKQPVARINMVELASADSVRVLLLPDSSRVLLNKNSRIQYSPSFEGNSREVYLYGEAYFEVARNEQKPFIVNCGETQTRVLGTEFNVKGYENDKDVVVTVVSGSVEFAEKKNSTHALKLGANDEVIFNKRSSAIASHKVKAGKANWWKKLDIKKGIKSFFHKFKKIIR